MINNVICTKKDVFTYVCDERGFKTHLSYKWRGIDVFGINQLSYLIDHEVKAVLMEKYYQKEYEIILNKIDFHNISKEELKIFLEHVEFVDS